MKILIVANNKSGRFSPFVVEQVDSLRALGVEIDYFGVSGKGFLGYLKCLSPLKQKINKYKPDIIHAHYGLSGLLANLQKNTPVVTTFHGSDIHSGRLNLFLSRICMQLSCYNIFVSEYIFNLSKYKKENYIVQACGLDIETIKPIQKSDAREYFAWKKVDKYVLFSGSFANSVKNYQLAKDAVEKFDDVELIELKGFSRSEVSLLMSASDCLLLTSFREASPTVVKEAMACNRPIVTTDVGDVRWVIGDTEGCYITSYEIDDCAEKLKQAIEFSRTKGETNGRERIISLGLNSETVAKKIVDIYNQVITK